LQWVFGLHEGAEWANRWTVHLRSSGSSGPQRLRGLGHNLRTGWLLRWRQQVPLPRRGNLLRDLLPRLDPDNQDLRWRGRLRLGEFDLWWRTCVWRHDLQDNLRQRQRLCHWRLLLVRRNLRDEARQRCDLQHLQSMSDRKYLRGRRVLQQRLRNSL
jgi:hypothetical protein